MIRNLSGLILRGGQWDGIVLGKNKNPNIYMGLHRNARKLQSMSVAVPPPTEEERYDATNNPNGIVNLGTGTNYLMHSEVSARITQLRTSQLGLGDSENLEETENETSRAVATFMTKFFKSSSTVQPHQIKVMNNVTSCIDLLGTFLGKPQDVLLCPAPGYSRLFKGCTQYSALEVVPVYLKHNPERDEYFCLSASALEDAIQEQTAQGKCVRGLIVNNAQLTNLLRASLLPLTPAPPVQGTLVFGIPYNPDNLHAITILNKMTLQFIQLLRTNQLMQEHMLYYLSDTHHRPDIIVTEEMIHTYIIHLYTFHQLPMGRLPVFGEPRGIIIGGGPNFSIRHGNVSWNINNYTVIPTIQHVREWGPFQTNARFIIISESKGFLRWLVDHGIFLLYGPGILATGSGVSDYPPRYFVAKLTREATTTNQQGQVVPVPVFLFVDPDEGGVRLAINYLNGSETLAELPGGFPGENMQNRDGNHYFRLASHTRYIGVSSQDLVTYDLGRPMTEDEFANMRGLQSSLRTPPPGLQSQLHPDIRTMINDFVANRRVGRLASIIDPMPTNPRFIINTYLRNKDPIIINPNNPSGQVYSSQLILEIMELCQRYGIHVIISEVYCLSVFDENCKFTSVLQLGSKIPDPDKTHVLWGLTKDLCLTEFHAATVYSADSELMSKIQGNTLFSGVSLTDQRLLTMYINDHDWIENFYLVKNHERMRRAYLRAKMKLESLDIEVFPSQAGFFLFCNFRRVLNPATEQNCIEMFKLFNRNRVYVVPYWEMRCWQPGWFRIVFTAEDHIFDAGFERIKSAIEEWQKSRRQ